MGYMVTSVTSVTWRCSEGSLYGGRGRSAELRPPLRHDKMISRRSGDSASASPNYSSRRRHFVSRRGRNKSAQGNALGGGMKSVTSPERAAPKGSALSGLVLFGRRSPRALPWAGVWLPLRGDRKAPLVIFRNRPTST